MKITEVYQIHDLLLKDQISRSASAHNLFSLPLHSFTRHHHIARIKEHEKATLQIADRDIIIDLEDEDFLQEGPEQHAAKGDDVEIDMFMTKATRLAQAGSAGGWRDQDQRHSLNIRSENDVRGLSPAHPPIEVFVPVRRDDAKNSGL